MVSVFKWGKASETFDVIGALLSALNYF